jgi:UDP-N-acetyl-D-mannosaminuronate dehydrogenase
MFTLKLKNRQLCLVKSYSTKTSHKYVTPDIGFIGLGEMGSRMAANLLKAGKQLIVYDVSRAPVELLKQQGAIGAASPKEVF